MRLSNSKLKTWRRCPRKYAFKYIEDIRPKSTALPLKRGTWIHECLQYHYDGEGWLKAHQRLTQDFYKLFEEEREEYGDLPNEVERIMRSYISHYKREDAKWVVVDSELDEIIPMPGYSDLSFNFIIDLIVEDDMGLWLVDHKTVKSFMDSDFMLLDAQLARYFWAAEYMGYTPLQGVIFNEIRTKAPAVPELLKKGGLSQRANMDTDLRTYYMEIKRHGLDPADYAKTLRRLASMGQRFFRRTKLPKDKSLTERLMEELVMGANEIHEAEKYQAFPRSPDKGCVWDCEYKDLCVTELMGGDIQPLVKMNYEVRNRGKD